MRLEQCQLVIRQLRDQGKGRNFLLAGQSCERLETKYSFGCNCMPCGVQIQPQMSEKFITHKLASNVRACDYLTKEWNSLPTFHLHLRRPLLAATQARMRSCLVNKQVTCLRLYLLIFRLHLRSKTVTRSYVSKDEELSGQ